MNKMRRSEAEDMAKELISHRNYEFFLTITFSRYAKELESDKNIIYILRFLNKKIFGQAHLKRGKFLRFVLVRGRVLSGLSHYHLLIEHDPELDFDELVDTFILCTQKAECLDPLTEDDRQLLITDKNHRLPETLSGYDKVQLAKNAGPVVYVDEDGNKVPNVRKPAVKRKINCNLVKILSPAGSMVYVVKHFQDGSWVMSGSTPENYYNINTRY